MLIIRHLESMRKEGKGLISVKDRDHLCGYPQSIK